jgi:hypothetical protein
MANDRGSDRSLWVVATPPLVALAAALQALGYTGTCTQNDIKPFLAGAFLSAPFLVAALALLLSHARRRLNSPSATKAIAGVLTALASGYLLKVNAGLTVETLIRRESPCGPDYFERGSVLELGHLLVGLAYGVLPALVLLAGLWTAAVSLKNASATRPHASS